MKLFFIYVPQKKGLFSFEKYIMHDLMPKKYFKQKNINIYRNSFKLNVLKMGISHKQTKKRIFTFKFATNKLFLIKCGKYN